ncbi:hypothetical protein EV360DRAFT_76324 [Lentinula raphanica]|nr:hypothetical protein EV360DRAFT_76324 [Lentinula raphanica]
MNASKQLTNVLKVLRGKYTFKKFGHPVQYNLKSSVDENRRQKSTTNHRRVFQLVHSEENDPTDSVHLLGLFSPFRSLPAPIAARAALETHTDSAHRSEPFVSYPTDVRTILDSLGPQSKWSPKNVLVQFRQSTSWDEDKKNTVGDYKRFLKTTTSGKLVIDTITEIRKHRTFRDDELTLGEMVGPSRQAERLMEEIMKDGGYEEAKSCAGDMEEFKQKDVYEKYEKSIRNSPPEVGEVLEMMMMGALRQHPAFIDSLRFPR